MPYSTQAGTVQELLEKLDVPEGYEMSIVRTGAQQIALTPDTRLRDGETLMAVPHIRGA